MALAYADETIRIRDLGGLNDRQIGAATGAAASTVRDWLRRKSVPTGTRAERIAELSAIVERLPRVMDPEYIPVWLAKPVEALDDDKPLDVIGRGEYRRVARLISELEDPGAV
jgi:transcriptional regulator with XRE-family HTH domain